MTKTKLDEDLKKFVEAGRLVQTSMSHESAKEFLAASLELYSAILNSQAEPAFTESQSPPWQTKIIDHAKLDRFANQLR